MRKKTKLEVLEKISVQTVLTIVINFEKRNTYLRILVFFF